MSMTEFKRTTNKLGESRIIKYTLIVIMILLLIRMTALGISFWILWSMKNGYFTGVDPGLMEKILEVLDVRVTGAIGTIATGVVARYGLRESANSFAAGRREDKGEVE